MQSDKNGEGEADLGWVTLGLHESGCKFALSPPTVGREKMENCAHTNLESQLTHKQKMLGYTIRGHMRYFRDL